MKIKDREKEKEGGEERRKLKEERGRRRESRKKRKICMYDVNLCPTMKISFSEKKYLTGITFYC